MSGNLNVNNLGTVSRSKNRKRRKHRRTKKQNYNQTMINRNLKKSNRKSRKSKRKSRRKVDNYTKNQMAGMYNNSGILLTDVIKAQIVYYLLKFGSLLKLVDPKKLANAKTVLAAAVVGKMIYNNYKSEIRDFF